MCKVVIIDYGAGNVHSVQYAVERLGLHAILSSDKQQIISADKIIFPGVGEAGSAMYEMKKLGLDRLIPSLKQPVLGVCLGMQLMCSDTEERNTRGLNIFPLSVLKFKPGEKIPHTGWNQLINLQSGLFNDVNEKSYVYFVHSYYVPLSVYTTAQTEYGVLFSSALKKNNFYGCQFHPEKSGDIGAVILKNFLSL